MLFNTKKAETIAGLGFRRFSVSMENYILEFFWSSDVLKHIHTVIERNHSVPPIRRQ